MADDVINSLFGEPSDIGSVVEDAERLQAADIYRLAEVWWNERTSPTLLPYPEELMRRMMDRVRRQIERVEDLTAQMDAGSSFSLVIMQTELERVKFMIRSLLRTRLSKIDKFGSYFLNHVARDTLSVTELEYVENHVAMLARHFADSALDGLPSKLRGLNDAGMEAQPDEDQIVFVRCIAPISKTSDKQDRVSDRNDDEDELGNMDNDDIESGDDNEGSGIDREFVQAMERRRARAHQQEKRNQGRQEIVVPLDDGRESISVNRGDVLMMRWSDAQNVVNQGLFELL